MTAGTAITYRALTMDWSQHFIKNVFFLGFFLLVFFFFTYISEQLPEDVSAFIIPICKRRTQISERSIPQPNATESLSV